MALQKNYIVGATYRQHLTSSKATAGNDNDAEGRLTCILIAVYLSLMQIYIDEQPFIAVPGSFTHPEQPEPTKESSPTVDYSPIIIATSSAMGGVILTLCLMVVCCCCMKKKDTKDASSSRVPLHPVVKVRMKKSYNILIRAIFTYVTIFQTVHCACFLGSEIHSYKPQR